MCLIASERLDAYVDRSISKIYRTHTHTHIHTYTHTIGKKTTMRWDDGDTQMNVLRERST